MGLYRKENGVPNQKAGNADYSEIDALKSSLVQFENGLIPQAIQIDSYGIGGNYVDGAGWIVFFPYSEARYYTNVTINHFDVYGLGQDIINASHMRIVGNTGTGMLLQPNNLNDGGVGANRSCHAIFTFSR